MTVGAAEANTRTRVRAAVAFVDAGGEDGGGFGGWALSFVGGFKESVHVEDAVEERRKILRVVGVEEGAAEGGGLGGVGGGWGSEAGERRRGGLEENGRVVVPAVDLRVGPGGEESGIGAVVGVGLVGGGPTGRGEVEHVVAGVAVDDATVPAGSAEEFG